MLINYLTAPDCVVWSAVLGSAAVPGILNPVPMMMKDGQGRLVCISDLASAPQLRERGIPTHVPALRPVVSAWPWDQPGLTSPLSRSRTRSDTNGKM